VGESVRAFYDALPFNFEDSPYAQAEIIRRANQLEAYPPLIASLSAAETLRILDVGCGTGWLSNSAAYWYGVPGIAVDLTFRALERARHTAACLGVASRIAHVCADVFALPRLLKGQKFGVVSAVGVLHHTSDCKKAMRTVSAMVAEGGYLLLGLYHRYGRQALLERFQPVRERLESAASDKERKAIEEEGFDLWRRLKMRPGAGVFDWSWYRDQCLHPHETQWTAKEVCGWLTETGIEPLSTSINRFEERPDWKKLFESEIEQREVGYEKVCREGTYFPGFFIVWGRKGEYRKR
jgi:SAM-dependent methyltransferase